MVLTSPSPPPEKTSVASSPSMEVVRGSKIVNLVQYFQNSGIFGLFAFTSVFVFLLGVCVYLDYGLLAASDAADGGEGFDKFVSVETHGGDLDSGACDWFDGEWIWDDTYPLYESKDCRFLDLGFRCSENGRPDRLYTKWRWQPKRCDLPRFDAKKMLEILRNKRLVFVGDSIGRNQWESLLCMLSSQLENKNSSIFEVNGNPITKHKDFLVFKFKDYNFTVEYYRAPFLVAIRRPPPSSPAKVRASLRVDVMDWSSRRWKDADVVVFNTGHWWNFEKTIRSGYYFQEGDSLRLNMSAGDGYQIAIQTMFQFLHNQVDTRKSLAFFRSYSPVHFRGRDWKTGGSCNMETLPDLEGLSAFSLNPWTTFFEPFCNASSAPENFVFLNVTRMTAPRRDGHPSIFYLGPGNTAPVHRQDCSHWCLPGIPDAWNELLYAHLFSSNTAAKTQNTPIAREAKKTQF